MRFLRYCQSFLMDKNSYWVLACIMAHCDVQRRGIVGLAYNSEVCHADGFGGERSNVETTRVHRIDMNNNWRTNTNRYVKKHLSFILSNIHAVNARRFIPNISLSRYVLLLIYPYTMLQNIILIVAVTPVEKQHWLSVIRKDTCTICSIIHTSVKNHGNVTLHAWVTFTTQSLDSCPQNRNPANDQGRSVPRLKHDGHKSYRPNPGWP